MPFDREYVVSAAGKVYPAASPVAGRRRNTGIAILAVSAVVALIAWIAWPLPKPLPVQRFTYSNGDYLGSAEGEYGSWVPLDKLPVHVLQAVVAVEDKRFFKRPVAIDLWAMARAARANARCGCVREGGSTLTQQLVKNRYLGDSSDTLWRKLREANIAVRLQLRRGRTAVAEEYLNTAPFGEGVFGIQAAARHYYNKDAVDLSLGEAAQLAASLKAPRDYGPGARAAWSRARVVLKAMAAQGYISAKTAKTTRRPRLRRPPNVATLGYVLDMLAKEAKASQWAKQDGLFTSTIDARLQRAADDAVGASRRVAYAHGARQAALVAIRPDGSVVAVVGGRSYQKSQFNRATQARRQVGSTFKPFIYAAAIKAGQGPESWALDAPVTIAGWSPKNFDGAYMGWMSYRDAFAFSRNAAAVSVADSIGLERVADMARQAGMPGPMTPAEPAFLLGSRELSPLNLALAFARLRHCRDITGHALTQAQPPPNEAACDHILTDSERAQLDVLLRATIAYGTGQAAQTPGWDCLGKTGTTNAGRDAWFVGECANLIAVVWLGNDNHRATQASGGLAAAIWGDFMRKALPPPNPNP